MFILETEDIKYNLIKEIGKGGTCSVYKGYPSEDSSTLYAIKIYKEHCKPFYDKEISTHYLDDLDAFFSAGFAVELTVLLLLQNSFLQ